ncbi:MAG TPA: multidrug transporter subunit MdtA, partial [Methylosinus sp.]
AVTIPRAAVQSGAQGPFVFVIGPGDKVGVRRVTLGPSRDGRIVVEEGLKAGERVVTEGADNLREGAVVSVPDPAPANHQKPAKGSAS